MSEPFLAEIRVLSFNFAPRGWALCNGQLLPINQNQALFSLLGTTYGGDGRVNFALPDLRGRTPVHFGDGITLGERAGQETQTLSSAEMPGHTHLLSASSANGDTPVAPGSILAAEPTAMYAPVDASLVAMAAGSITTIGGSQAHTNMMPYLTLNFCIALQGIFPSTS